MNKGTLSEPRDKTTVAHNFGHMKGYVNTSYTTIVDLNMPFKNMVIFYLKFSFAVIPAGLLWSVIYYFVTSVIIKNY